MFLFSFVACFNSFVYISAQLTADLDSLRQQLNSHGPTPDQNKAINKLEKELQTKRAEVVSLKEKVR